MAARLSRKGTFSCKQWKPWKYLSKGLARTRWAGGILSWLLNMEGIEPGGKETSSGRLLQQLRFGSRQSPRDEEVELEPSGPQEDP